MSDDRVLSAAELEKLTPDERHRLVNERVVTDVSKVRPEFLARARSKGRKLLEAREAVGTTQQ